MTGKELLEKYPRSLKESPLDRYRWFNESGIDRVSTWITDDCESIARYVKNLAVNEHGYDASVAANIDKAIEALTSGLLSAKLSKSSYEKRKPVKIAAE